MLATDIRRGCWSLPALRCDRRLAILKFPMCLRISTDIRREAAILDAVGVPKVGFPWLQNLLTKKSHDMGLESSSGAEKNHQRAQQNEPDAASRGPNSNSAQNVRKFSAGNRPLRSPLHPL
jgi:hypothetical protein